ncbi:MAG: hypothetical protein K2I30_02890 [Clostridia bacterium]|nr:hypothetical protein [Clostridia bacterium]
MQNSVFDFIFTSDVCESIKPSVQYMRFSNESDKLYRRLKELLNDEQFDIFDKFINLAMGMESEAIETYFIEGFKMGMRIAAERLTKA